MDKHCTICYSSELVHLHKTQFPLTTQSWPKTCSEAKSAKKFPVDLYLCQSCGHIFNYAFDDTAIPYDSKPDYTYNAGKENSHFLQSGVALVSSMTASTEVVVEVGHGDASFCTQLALLRPDLQIYGFDTCGAVASQYNNLSLYKGTFSQNIFRELQPSVIIMRQVIEHFKFPVETVKSMIPSNMAHDLKFFFEVPSIDKALSQGRIYDFQYEHVSHFTESSFSKFLQCLGTNFVTVQTVQSGETIRAYGNILREERLTHLNSVISNISVKVADIKKELSKLGSVALWGVTGRGAVQASLLELDSISYPFAVDSDIRKVGTHVPGLGQKIISPQELLKLDIDAILVLPTWRALDIFSEVREMGLSTKVYIADFAYGLKEVSPCHM